MSLIVHDEYIKEVGEFVENEGDLLEEALCKYVQIMTKVIEEGIKSGTTSDALKEFVSQVSNETIEDDSNPSSLGKKTKRYGSNYILRIDKADKHLYD